MVASTRHLLAVLERSKQRDLSKAARRRRRPKSSAKRQPRSLAEQERSKEKRKQFHKDLADSRAVILVEAQRLQALYPNHNAEYYRRAILQFNSKIRCSSGREMTAWNLHVRVKVREANNALQTGEKRFTPSAMMPMLKATYSALLEELGSAMAVKEFYQDELEAVEREKSADPVPATTNVLLRDFHDARANLNSIEQQLKDLHGRTGTEAFIVAVRPTGEDFLSPFYFGTSERARNFATMSLAVHHVDLPGRFEGFVLSGVKGCAIAFAETLASLKKEATALVLQKASEAYGRSIPKMHYAGFDEAITLKYGLVLDHWPLPKFCSPATLTIMNDLRILLNAFRSGSTKFRKLTNAEYEAFAAPFTSQRADSSVNGPNGDGPQPGDPPTLPTSTSASGEDGSRSPSATTEPARSPLVTITSTITNASSTVTNNNGTPIGVQAKKRKTRSDKGVCRGPRKKAAMDAPPLVPSAVVGGEA